MSEDAQTPREKLEQETDGFAIIVTIDLDEETAAVIGFSVLSWGETFKIDPHICWWEGTETEFNPSDLEEEDLKMAHVAAARAIAKMMAEQLEDDLDYEPDYWN